MTHNLNIKLLLLALAAPFLVSVANAESVQIDTELDWKACHSSLGDLDGDGDLDLVTSASRIDTFAVYLNNSDGTFGLGQQVDTELDEGAEHTSLGDLDGDGDLDLVTSAWHSDAFTVFLGKGDGTFRPGIQVDTELDEFANHTSLGDLNGDGDLDLVTSALGADAFTVFLGNGDGIFGPGQQVDTELDESAEHTNLGDLDEDGDLDLVTSAKDSDAFTVFLGNGDGTFGPGSQIDTELDDWANYTSLGDLDGDGDLDLVTSAWHSDAFAVHLND